ncbi:hypothetical protein [Streptomyces dysideae]|uniref:hypothetical protein n=1 Tax=Streptomyces dysideae TaxID=909626 RepID=UPI000ACDCBDA|nr:hypothetical protein [Streptomyces dysideae]
MAVGVGGRVVAGVAVSVAGWRRVLAVPAARRTWGAAGGRRGDGGVPLKWRQDLRGNGVRL